MDKRTLKTILKRSQLKEGWYLRTVCNMEGTHFVMEMKLVGVPKKRRNVGFEMQLADGSWSFVNDLIGVNRHILHKHTPTLAAKLRAMSLEELYATQKRKVSFKDYLEGLESCQSIVYAKNKLY
jgi:hypothetical protein